MLDMARSVWLPGSVNDLNILDMSSTMERIFCGEFPPSFTFLVNNVAFKTAYFLADGINPARALFIKTIRKAMSPKDKRDASAQEAIRKGVERSFAALVARWHILKQLCRLAKRDEMANVMKACILMTNMIVEGRRDNYESGLYKAAESSADAAEVNSFYTSLYGRTVPRSSSAPPPSTSKFGPTELQRGALSSQAETPTRPRRRISSHIFGMGTELQKSDERGSIFTEG
jgi:Plant transposon protein